MRICVKERKWNTVSKYWEIWKKENIQETKESYKIFKKKGKKERKKRIKAKKIKIKIKTK